MIKKWFDVPIQELQNGKKVTIYPKGNSMTPKIESGAEVTLEPIDDVTSIKRGNIVLVKVGSNVYLHLVTAVDNYRVQISNNHGHVNGWTSKEKVFGRVIKVNNNPKAVVDREGKTTRTSSLLEEMVEETYAGNKRS